MSWTRTEAEAEGWQEQLADPLVPLIAYWCPFCEAEYTRPEDRTTCPVCGIGPMEKL